MAELSGALVIAISAAGFTGVLVLTLALPGIIGERSGGLVRRREDESQRALEGLFIRSVTPRQVTALTLIGSLAVAVVLQFLTNNLVIALGAAAAVLFLPKAVFAYLRRARIDRFEEQLPDALTILANSAKAGLSLTQALEQVAERSTPPASEEFGVIVHELKLGTDLGKSIEDARKRLSSRSFSLVATALQVNREKGGNLPEALHSMSNSLKEIWRVEQRLITASAEGRKAIWLISGMPLFIMLLVSFFQPSIPKMLTTDFIGIVVLLIASALYGFGLWWLTRVLGTEV